MQVLPCFTVGFDYLSRSKYFAAVHAGAVVQRNTVSVVIFILVMWAVTATLTGHTGILEITSNKTFLTQAEL